MAAATSENHDHSSNTTDLTIDNANGQTGNFTYSGDEVRLSEELKHYIVDIVQATRTAEGVQLTVSESNEPARSLYAKRGFRQFGVEPLAIAVGDEYVGKVHMWRPVESS